MNLIGIDIFVMFKGYFLVRWINVSIGYWSLLSVFIRIVVVFVFLGIFDLIFDFCFLEFLFIIVGFGVKEIFVFWFCFLLVVSGN